jgi:hypothetical protein
MIALLRHLLFGLHCVDLCADLDAEPRRANRQRLSGYEQRLDAWLRDPREWDRDPAEKGARLVELDVAQTEAWLVARSEAGQQLRRRLAGLWAREPWDREPPPPEIGQAFTDWLRSGQPEPRTVLRLAHRR